jgi:N-acyl-D-amino-acid deacylase
MLRGLGGLLAAPAAVLQGAEDTAPLDEAMQNLMRRHGIPGGALAIARAGQLVYAQGFGFSSRERGEAATAESKFRLASLSKPITAMAILRLMEQGRLGLDEAILPRLNLEPLHGKFADGRWGSITVRHLLLHTGGWVKNISGDIMFKSREVCREAGTRGPADAVTTIRCMMSRKLDAAPGTKHSYCNFGYVLLGHLLAEVTGRSYESAVRQLVLKPSGADGLQLGHTMKPLRGEVRYYHHDGSLGPSVYAGMADQVPWPCGTFSLETNAANGGWVGSVLDLIPFLTSLDERSKNPLLQPQTLRLISQSGATGEASYHGLGWIVRPNGQGGRPNFWYVGGLPGTKAIMTRLGDGFDWVTLFNLRPAVLDAFNTEVQNTVHAAANKVWS